MSGVSYYAQVGWWACGKRDINGQPGYQNPSHVDFTKPDAPIPASTPLARSSRSHCPRASRRARFATR